MKEPTMTPLEVAQREFLVAWREHEQARKDMNAAPTGNRHTFRPFLLRTAAAHTRLTAATAALAVALDMADRGVSA